MPRLGNQVTSIKFNIMKKIFFVALTATLLAASCQKTEVIRPSGEPAMSFSTSMSKLTKSVGTADAEGKGQKNLEAQDFSVWAYADNSCDFSNSTVVDEETGIYDGMENILIECTSAFVDAVIGTGTEAEPQTPARPAVWNTGKEYYWPGKNKNLKFFAVSADGDWLRKSATCPVDIDLNDGTGENGIPTMTIEGFKVAHEKVVDTTDPTKVKTAANEDLMVADYVIQDQDDRVDKAVNLKFRHALAKVQFLFKTVTTPGTTVYVQSLKVADLETTADLNVSFAPGTGIASFAWGNLPLEESETLEDFTDDWETSIITNEEEKLTADDVIDTDFPTLIEGKNPTAADKVAMKLTATGGDEDPAQVFATWLMIPQSVAGKKVEITYLINERKFTSVFALDANLTGAKWADNQYIRYTVTLAPNIIKFVPEVDGWDQYDANSSQAGNQDIEMQN